MYTSNRLRADWRRSKCGLYCRRIPVNMRLLFRGSAQARADASRGNGN